MVALCSTISCKDYCIFARSFSASFNNSRLQTYVLRTWSWSLFIDVCSLTAAAFKTLTGSVCHCVPIIQQFHPFILIDTRKQKHRGNSTLYKSIDCLNSLVRNCYAYWYVPNVEISFQVSCRMGRFFTSF